jgi:hypothetical protein
MYVFPVTVALEVKYKNELLEKKRNDHELTLPLFVIHGNIELLFNVGNIFLKNIMIET